MLLAVSSLEELYHKCCGLAEDAAEVREDFIHPTRLISFLVGLRGRTEAMPIGGAWSPELDGPNPEANPQTLINTAVRTCRCLTGIDLSLCSQWYRLMEVKYHRPEETHKGRVVPARVETVVIFLPDVWSCMPSRLEWINTCSAYKRRQSGGGGDDDDKDVTASQGEVQCVDPAHWSDVDPKLLKVSELRRELDLRNLSSKGLKSQLVARLTKAARAEQEEEESDAKANGEKVEEEEEKMEEEAKEEKEEEEKKVEVELPENPVIMVHPSRTAKGGKFDCTVMSLSVLLDYRQEDNKEHSFEVSLFAEMFNEMLVRDFGFKIYKLLMGLPEKEEEDRDKRKKDKKDDKKDDDEKKDKEEKRKDDKDKDDKEEDKDKDDDKDDDDDEEEDDNRDLRLRSKSREKDRKKPREKLQYVTVNPAALLAFVYFDQNHTGYLLDKDLEDIIYMLGLHLSRAQIKRLLLKVVTRDTLNYRKLTDKPRSSKDAVAETKENGDDDEMIVDTAVEELAAGNLLLMKQTMAGGGDPTSAATSASKSRVGEAGGAAAAGAGADNWVMYRGSLLDVENLLQRLERSERNRKATEEKLQDREHEVERLQTSVGEQTDASRTLTAELKKTQKKLAGVEQQQRQAEGQRHTYYDTLAQSRHALTTLLSNISLAVETSECEGTEEVEGKSSRAVKQEPGTEAKVKDESKNN
ncbi:PREDICTED: cell division cycle and apoptosis regulator protein 1-like [Priapulus caudatus]|uniref:Cell division cycle and apoptosis regulator protein 1-like n=1 Tax=Priapulus caudatus TaxID=37621 RepID=A0ABM1E9K7_PRICU|nr:PREDICTED: cell division cycle and apoptosis regulator protein 1-like [Priapulus caudatus]